MSALLQVDKLAKRFGGIVATDDVVFEVPEGELHAVIGPNGAGKTTLIAQLSGQLLADSGTIRFAGADITRLPAWRRSHLGLARSFQITSLFLDLSVLDNVALAVQAHAGHSFSFWRNARGEADLRAPARAALEQVGLAPSRRGARLAARATASIACSSSRWRSPDARACCCSTSRWPASAPTNPRAWSGCLPA